MAEDRKQKLAREMSHRFSASQMSPGWERYFETSERDNPPIGLEQPLIAPLDLLGPAQVKGALNLAKRAGKGYSKLAAEAVARAVEGGSPLTALAQPAYVVKPKGGNWLSGSVEDALHGLKRPLGEAHNRAMFTDEMMSDPRIAAEVARRDKEASINSWIEGPLTKYVKTRMASPDDEVRKLAEQGVLHVQPDQLMGPGYAGPQIRRNMANKVMPGVGRIEGKSDVARAWEDASDMSVGTHSYKDLIPMRLHPAAMYDALYSHGGEYAVKNPEALAHVFNTGQSVRGLGFPHLIDELSNALNPASGLPRNLQLTPEAMQNMGMEKAVRRVHEINQFRKAAMEQARLKELETSGMLGTLTREYAENNPMGLRWVEYTRPEKLHEDVTNIAKHGDEYVALGADGQPIAQRLPDGSTGRLATGKTPEDAHLAGQLITEGNIMGNCVGGHCEDVASGRSRIFSLKDKKGEPHVTVEVEPVRGYADQASREELFTPELQQEWLSGVESGEVPSNLTQAEWARQKFNKPQPMSIKQIKGKQNKAPKEEYLPFVQDFVRNSPLGGKWSDVGDLGNTGLMRHPKTGEYFLPEEYRNLPDNYGYANGGIVESRQTAKSWNILAD